MSKINISSLLGIESRPCSPRPLTLLTAPSQLRIGHHIHPMLQCKYTAYLVTPIRRNNNNLETQSCKKEDKNQFLFTFKVIASDSLVDENWWRINMSSSYSRHPFEIGIVLLRTGTLHCGQPVPYFGTVCTVYCTKIYKHLNIYPTHTYIQTHRHTLIYSVKQSLSWEANRFCS